MKKIINGKRYDTKTADCIASYSNSLPASDFRSYEEDLYRTKQGAWFLVGEGGPMTKYARTNGNETSGGENLIPLSIHEAGQWLEQHNCTEALEEYFTVEDA